METENVVLVGGRCDGYPMSILRGIDSVRAPVRRPMPKTISDDVPLKVPTSEVYEVYTRRRMTDPQGRKHEIMAYEGMTEAEVIAYLDTRGYPPQSQRAKASPAP